MLNSAKETAAKFFQNGGLTLTGCMLSVIILSLYIHLLPVAMIIWALLWIYENKSDININIFRNNKAAVLFGLFVVFYLWQISGLIFAESITTGLERLFKRLSFFVFPMVLFYPGPKVKSNINLILRVFATGIFIYLLICFGNALGHSLSYVDQKWIFQPHPPEYPWESHFFAERLSAPVHPSYLAMYILVSILIALEALFDSSTSYLKKGFWGIAAIVFVIAIYLLSARAGILAGILVLPVYCFLKFYKSIPKLLLVVAMVLLSIIFIIGASKNIKVSTSIESFSAQPIDSTLKTDARLLIWQSALGVIKKNPLTGVGTGDATNSLIEEFKARGYVNGFYDNLNAHNQFLEIWIENGIIGLLLFLTIIGYIFYIAISSKNLVLGLYMTSVIVFFMFESMLNRIAGVSFFALFSFLLIHIKQSPSEPD